MSPSPTVQLPWDSNTHVEKLYLGLILSRKKSLRFLRGSPAGFLLSLHPPTGKAVLFPPHVAWGHAGTRDARWLTHTGPSSSTQPVLAPRCSPGPAGPKLLLAVALCSPQSCVSDMLWLLPTCSAVVPLGLPPFPPMPGMAALHCTQKPFWASKEKLNSTLTFHTRSLSPFQIRQP